MSKIEPEQHLSNNPAALPSTKYPTLDSLKCREENKKMYQTLNPNPQPKSPKNHSTKHLNPLKQPHHPKPTDLIPKNLHTQNPEITPKTLNKKSSNNPCKQRGSTFKTSRLTKAATGAPNYSTHDQKENCGKTKKNQDIWERLCGRNEGGVFTFEGEA